MLFQDGRLRLLLPTGLRALPIWNTPAPPNLDLCPMYGADPSSCCALYAVEMDKIKGITFFFSGGQLFGIHIHDSEESCAMDTFERSFSNRLGRTIVWVYLPISENDCAFILGIREALHTHHLNVLVRTERVGDIIIGEQCRGPIKDRRLAASASVTVIYGEPREDSLLHFFGANYTHLWL